MNETDEKLVAKYLKGDELALETLIKKYLPLIYSFSRQYSGNSANASDIAQETFVKAWRHLKKFDQTKSFKSWLFTIAKNTALDWLRKKEEVPFSSFENNERGNILESIVDPLVSTEEAFAGRERAGKLKRTFDALPENYKAILSLKQDEFTFKEIAKLIKAPINTVKSQYRRALLLLKKQIEG